MGLPTKGGRSISRRDWCPSTPLVERRPSGAGATHGGPGGLECQRWRTGTSAAGSLGGKTEIKGAPRAHCPQNQQPLYRHCFIRTDEGFVAEGAGPIEASTDDQELARRQ